MQQVYLTRVKDVKGVEAREVVKAMVETYNLKLQNGCYVKLSDLKIHSYRFTKNYYKRMEGMFIEDLESIGFGYNEHREYPYPHSYWETIHGVDIEQKGKYYDIFLSTRIEKQMDEGLKSYLELIQSVGLTPILGYGFAIKKHCDLYMVLNGGHVEVPENKFRSKKDLELESKMTDMHWWCKHYKEWKLIPWLFAEIYVDGQDKEILELAKRKRMRYEAMGKGLYIEVNRDHCQWDNDKDMYELLVEKGYLAKTLTQEEIY